MPVRRPTEGSQSDVCPGVDRPGSGRSNRDLAEKLPEKKTPSIGLAARFLRGAQKQLQITPGSATLCVPRWQHDNFSTIMTRKRVYISSTNDELMRPFRHAASSVIKNGGHYAVDSYSAGAKPTVEQCLADVDSCDVFVGIVGLRYGWIPPDGNPRSITHREFDRAGDKTRLVFMMDDSHVDLDKPITDFRKLIPSAVLPLLFSDLDKFSAGLLKSLKERVGIIEPISPLLPFFCDRGPQLEKVETGLWQRRMRNDMRLRIFLVHGDAQQCGAQFVDVLHHKLREFPATKDLAAPTVFELEWPKTFVETAHFRNRISQAVADKILKNRHAPIEDVERCLREIEGPVLIHTYLSTTEYGSTGEKAIHEFCSFWEERPQWCRFHPLVVVLRVEYELPRQNILTRWWTPQVERTNESIRRFVNERFKYSELGEALEELHRIPVDEAIRWSHDEEVRKYLRGAAYEPRIRDIYERKFSQEPERSPRMDPLARELMALFNEGG